LSLDYVLYVLIVACAVLACGVAIYVARPPARRKYARTPQRLSGKDERRSPALAPGAIDRGAADTTGPSPWGWPAGAGVARSGHARPGQAAAPSSPLQRWTDQWVVEKKTTADAGYRAHREECIKALLEDRFCSQRRATADAERREPPKGGGNGQVQLGDVRTPWGW
jgi:hypothetical protein